MIHSSINDIRKQLKTKRALLSLQQQQQASEKIALNIKSLQIYQAAKHIAFYYPANCEIDLSEVWRDAWQQQKQCYLPVLANKQLQFIHYQANTTLMTNQYGILEPQRDDEHIIKPEMLDVVFVPLVAFDPDGCRLGMGAGYYDRTFTFLKRSPEQLKFIGVAYEFQRLNAVPQQPWDVKLTAVITEKMIHGDIT